MLILFSSSLPLQLFNVDGEGAMCQSRLTHGLVQPFTRWPANKQIDGKTKNYGIVQLLSMWSTNNKHPYNWMMIFGMMTTSVLSRLYNGSWVFAALSSQVPKTNYRRHRRVVQSAPTMILQKRCQWRCTAPSRRFPPRCLDLAWSTSWKDVLSGLPI